MSTGLRYVTYDTGTDPSARKERGRALAAATQHLDSAVALVFHAITCSRPDFGSGETLTLIALAHATDHTIAGGTEFRGITQEELVKWTNASRSTISRCLTTLCQAGWVRMLDGKGVLRYALHRELNKKAESQPELTTVEASC